jgi:hypothetical protein
MACWQEGVQRAASVCVLTTLDWLRSSRLGVISCTSFKDWCIIVKRDVESLQVDSWVCATLCYAVVQNVNVQHAGHIVENLGFSVFSDIIPALLIRIAERFPAWQCSFGQDGGAVVTSK